MMMHVCDIEDYSCLNGLCDLFLNDVEPETNLDADVVAPWDECCELSGLFEELS